MSEARTRRLLARAMRCAGAACMTVWRERDGLAETVGCVLGTRRRLDGTTRVDIPGVAMRDGTQRILALGETEMRAGDWLSEGDEWMEVLNANKAGGLLWEATAVLGMPPAWAMQDAGA